MKKQISPVFIVLALAAVFVAGLIYIIMIDTSKPDGFIEGHVIDAKTGKAVPGVDVSAVDSAGISYNERENTDATHQDGSFLLQLPPGDYTIRLNAAGYLPYESTASYTVTSKETYEVSEALVLEPQESVTWESSTQEPPMVTTTQEQTTTATEPPTTTTTQAPVTTMTQAPTATTTQAPTATTRATPLVVDPNTVENYGSNLNPYLYSSYYSDVGDFYFSYPTSLYCSASSDYSQHSTPLGTNIETHTLSGSRGSVLTYSLIKRTDSLNLPAVKDRIYAQEASEITIKQKKLLDQYAKKEGFARFVVTGFNQYGNIIYKLVKVTPSYIMEMRIECPDYINDKDKMEKRYVQDCLYRYCGFANDKAGDPQSYSDFLKSQK